MGEKDNSEIWKAIHGLKDTNTKQHREADKKRSDNKAEHTAEHKEIFDLITAIRLEVKGLATKISIAQYMLGVVFTAFIAVITKLLWEV